MLPPIRYIPALWGHWLKVMDMPNFSVMQINGLWHVSPDWNNSKYARVPWIFNPMYNSSLTKDKK